MHVLLVNALFHPFTGGVEKHLLELSRELVKQGVRVTLLTSQLEGTKLFEVMQGVRVHRLPSKFIKIPGLYPPPVVITPKIWEALDELNASEPFDVIHLQDRWFPDFDSVCWWANKRGKPLVVTIHNARTLGISFSYSVFGTLYDELLGKWVFKAADKIISVSAWAREDIAQLGVDKNKIVTIPNAIDSSEFHPRNYSFALRKKWLGDARTPFLLYVGRLIKQKGLKYLLESMPVVLGSFPDAKLIFVGRGNDQKKLQEQAKKLGLEKNVVFKGFIDEEELKTAFASCDLFVLSSLWEVLPIAILEAMSSGKPIVCTDAGGDAELVADGVNGFVVPKRKPKIFAKKVVEILSNEKLKKKMGVASRIRAVKEFNWPMVAKKTIQVYKTLVKKRLSSKHW